MARRREFIVGLGLLLLAGCASVAPAVQARVDTMQAFADRVTTQAGVRPIPIAAVSVSGTGHPTFGAAYLPDDRRIVLGPNVLVQFPEVLPWTMAHELAHALLGHVRTHCPVGSAGAQCEMDANALAVQILATSWPLTESEALFRGYTYLVRVKRESGPAVGHATPCEEIRDLLARFPQHRPLWQTWECAPK